MCVFLQVCYTSTKKMGNKNLWTIKEPLCKPNKQAHEGLLHSNFCLHAFLKNSLPGTQLGICQHAIDHFTQSEHFYPHQQTAVCPFLQSLLPTARQIFKRYKLYHIIPCLKLTNSFPLHWNKTQACFSDFNVFVFQYCNHLLCPLLQAYLAPGLSRTSASGLSPTHAGYFPHPFLHLWLTLLEELPQHFPPFSLHSKNLLQFHHC